MQLSDELDYDLSVLDLVDDGLREGLAVLVHELVVGQFLLEVGLDLVDGP